MSIVESALQRIRGNVTKKPAEAPRDDSATATISGGSNASRQMTLEGVTKPSGRQPSPPFSIEITALQELGYLPTELNLRRQREQYRVIKRRLLEYVAGQRKTEVSNPGVVLVTSSLPGEGKTYTTLNLALSIAEERDYGVVLIDADVRKRHITSLLQLSKRPGLLEFLEQRQLQLDDVIVPTSVDGLFVIPAGNSGPNEAELLASNRFNQLIGEVRNSHKECVILLDSAPLLVASESAALTAGVGQVVLVVKATSTSQDAVAESLARINPKPLVSCVLNQWEPVLPSERRYYGAIHQYYGPH